VRVRSLLVALCGTAVVLLASLAGSGNGALPSAATALGAAPVSHVAVSDAFVSARSPERNFGRLPSLRVGGEAQARTYLRFRLRQPRRPGGPAARLHLFATAGTRSGIAVRLLRTHIWREGDIAGETAPRLGPVVARVRRVRGGRLLTIDVSHAVTGKRTVDLAIVRRGTTGETRFLSRESGRDTAPRLVLGEAAPRPPMVAAAGDMVCDPNSPNRRDLIAGTCLDRETSDLLVRRELAAVLTLGDNQYERGELSAFQTAYDATWGRVKSITRPTVGNHEYLTPGAAGYFDYFNGIGRATGRAGVRGQGWYSFDLEGWHLVALNSMCDEVGGCGPGSPQLEWLKADLAAHPAACTLAYWHHPRFSSGVPGSNVRTDAFWRVLYDAGADVVLTGHSHDYERFAPQTPDALPDGARGIRQFVVGTGGKNNYPFGVVRPNSEVRDARTSGVLLLTLRAGGYDWQFDPVPGGRLRDAGSGACH
jgi:hypothetical protein